jgi:hypothetical protein
MSLQRPLVVNLTTGEIERLSSSDYLDERDILHSTNNTGGALVIGTAVYQTTVADEIAKAKADSMTTAVVSGLILDVSVADAGIGGVLTDGKITATTAQWDAVTGDTGGLTPGSKYFLSAATAGKLTKTAPSADGQVLAPLGVAKSTTEFEITIGTRIKL